MDETGWTVDYEEPDKRRVRALFKSRLDTIAASERDPTPWEAECLVDALAAMAVDSWTLAEHLVGQAGYDREPRGAPVDVTTDSLRSAFEGLQGH